MPPPPHGHGTVRDRSGPFGFPCSSLPPAAPGGPLHWVPAGKGRCPQGPGQGWAGRRRLLGRLCGRGGYSLARVITQYLSVGAHSASDSQFSWPQHTWQCSAWAGGRSAGRQGAGPGRGWGALRPAATWHAATCWPSLSPPPPSLLPSLPPERMAPGPWEGWSWGHGVAGPGPACVSAPSPGGWDPLQAGVAWAPATPLHEALVWDRCRTKGPGRLWLRRLGTRAGPGLLSSREGPACPSLPGAAGDLAPAHRWGVCGKSLWS